MVSKIITMLQDLICDHEIRNVNSACQDTECLSYFAYITKHLNDFYCHVFNTDTAVSKYYA